MVRRPLDPEDTNWGQRVETRHQENVRRLNGIEERLGHVETKMEKILNLLGAIKLSSAFTKWILGIGAAIAIIFSTAYAVITGHRID